MSVIDEIAAERARQISDEGWTHEHDDKFVYNELSKAASCYAVHDPNFYWPWSAEWWKTTTERRDLIKAAALIVAEIERLDRKEQAK